MGFIGSANDIIFSTEPAVQGCSQVFNLGNFWDCLGVGWDMGQEGALTKCVGVSLVAFDLEFR